MTESIDPRALMENLSFCVFDLETTGGDHNNDKIIEIGLVKIEKMKVTKELTYLVDPEIPIPEFIQRLTSIKTKDLVGKPKIEEIIDMIVEFMGDSILVAHNASFDVPFFNSVLKRLNRKKLPNNSLCTNMMTKYLIPEILTSNLAYMSKLFDLPDHKAHRALNDAKAAANLLLIYLDVFVSKDINKINQLYYPRNRFELDTLHLTPETPLASIMERLCKISGPCTLTLKGEQGVILALLPIERPEAEKEFIQEQLTQIEWKNLSIKMHGPFLQALLAFNLHYAKMDKKVQHTILKHLNHRHPAEGVYEDIFEMHDFLITRHLIPEQYVVYSFLNLTQSNELVFRHPSHGKKLLQYLVNHVKRFNDNKKHTRFNCLHPDIRPFVTRYLCKIIALPNSPYMLFSRGELLTESSQMSFLDKLKYFHDHEKHPYYFPKIHL